MSLHTKDFLKKYALLTIAFIFSLFIPYLLYSIKGNNLYHKTGKSYEYPPMVKYSFKWPDIASFNNNITSPPPPFHQKTQKEQQDILREIDQKFCGQDRCKFLLPIAITEQGIAHKLQFHYVLLSRKSKAQLHFRQLAFLSGNIGRTIVLPNVYNSHFGACLPHSFDFYFDENWLKNNQNHFNYITMEDFKSWLLARHYAGVVPTGQEIYMQRSQRSRLLKNIKNCFQDSFDFSGRPVVNYQLLDHQSAPSNMNLTDIMMNLLSDEARQHEYLDANNLGVEIPPVDVINLFYDRRYQFMKNHRVNEPITYSKRWVDIADKISEQLKPYIAIHWRMERLEPVSNLLPCAVDLIDEIHKLDPEESENKHPNVFLLTDYPHLLNSTGAVPESNSFSPKQLKPEHHEAISYLYGHLNISLTTIADKKIHYDQLPKDNWHLIPIDTKGNTDPTDRSILGIIDKLVAMRAQWFFAGRPGVCAKSSSFTGRISSKRLNAFRNGDENIIVPLQTFNLKTTTTSV